MNDDVIRFLKDILDCINAIEEHVGVKKDFFEYKKNRIVRRAVEREIEIIGEATNRLMKIDSNLNITATRKNYCDKKQGNSFL